MENEADQRQRAERFVFSGRVQGVGFRYTVVQISRRYPIAGFVRNRADGTVELVAVGRPKDVRQFTEAIATSMRDYIAECLSEPYVSEEVFTTFSVRH